MNNTNIKNSIRAVGLSGQSKLDAANDQILNQHNSSLLTKLSIIIKKVIDSITGQKYYFSTGKDEINKLLSKDKGFIEILKGMISAQNQSTVKITTIIAAVSEKIMELNRSGTKLTESQLTTLITQIESTINTSIQTQIAQNKKNEQADAVKKPQKRSLTDEILEQNYQHLSDALSLENVDFRAGIKSKISELKKPTSNVSSEQKKTEVLSTIKSLVNQNSDLKKNFISDIKYINLTISDNLLSRFIQNFESFNAWNKAPLPEHKNQLLIDAILLMQLQNLYKTL